MTWNYPQVVKKNNFKCLNNNNNNKTTGGAYRNSMVTALQKKGRRMSPTAESTHLSTTLRTHTHRVCRALEHWANFQLTSDLNCYLPLLNHLPFTTRPRVSPAYIINKPKELQQADLSVEAWYKHRLTIPSLGGKKLNIYQKAISDPFHLGVVFVCKEKEEEKSVETKKMEVKWEVRTNRKCWPKYLCCNTSGIDSTFSSSSYIHYEVHT